MSTTISAEIEKLRSYKHRTEPASDNVGVQGRIFVDAVDDLRRSGGTFTAGLESLGTAFTSHTIASANLVQGFNDSATRLESAGSDNGLDVLDIASRGYLMPEAVSDAMARHEQRRRLEYGDSHLRVVQSSSTLTVSAEVAAMVGVEGKIQVRVEVLDDGTTRVQVLALNGVSVDVGVGASAIIGAGNDRGTAGVTATAGAAAHTGAGADYAFTTHEEAEKFVRDHWMQIVIGAQARNPNPTIPGVEKITGLIARRWVEPSRKADGYVNVVDADVRASASADVSGLASAGVSGSFTGTTTKTEYGDGTTVESITVSADYAASGQVAVAKLGEFDPRAGINAIVNAALTIGADGHPAELRMTYDSLGDAGTLPDGDALYASGVGELSVYQTTLALDLTDARIARLAKEYFGRPIDSLDVAEIASVLTRPISGELLKRADMTVVEYTTETDTQIEIGGQVLAFGEVELGAGATTVTRTATAVYHKPPGGSQLQAESQRR